MGEGCEPSDKEGRSKVELLIVKIQVLLQVLVSQEIACMGWNTATCHDLCSFPESEEALILVEDLCYVDCTQSASTRLHMRLR